MKPFDKIEFAKKNKALIAVNESLKIKYSENVLYLIIINPSGFEGLLNLLNINVSRPQLTNILEHLVKHKLIYKVNVGTRQQLGRYEPTTKGKKYLNYLEAKIDI